MITKIQKEDIVISRAHRARTLLLRDGTYYSVNVLSSNRLEIRYPITRKSELVFLGYREMELAGFGFG